MLFSLLCGDLLLFTAVPLVHGLSRLVAFRFSADDRTIVSTDKSLSTEWTRHYNTHGKAACPSKAIPESVLEAITNELGGIGKITVLEACEGNTLVLTLTSGEQIVKRWQDRSRRQSWTPEMKEKARQKDLERRSHHAST